MIDLADFADLIPLDHGLCVLNTVRPGGGIQSSVVNAGVLDHPLRRGPVVGLVATGGSRKLRHLRIDPRATIVARAGWRWATVEGDAEIIPFTGTRAGDVLAETLEVAPFESVLYSSDGNVLPELHHLAAVLRRHHLGRLLDTWLADGVLDTAAAERLARGAGAGNATRLHSRLPAGSDR